MDLQGQIVDSATGAGLPGASVLVVDAQGNLTSTGVAADNSGNFDLNSPLLDSSGSELQVSYTGYTPVKVPVTYVQQYGAIPLINTGGTELTPAVIVATLKKNSPVIGIAILAVLVWYGTRSERKVGDMPKIDWVKIAMGGGIAIGAYFLIIKPILTKLGIFGSAQATANAAATASTQKQLQAAGGQDGTATYTTANYTSFANTIYNALDADTPDQDTAVNTVIQANTLLDLINMIAAFGTRPAKCLIFGLDCTQYDMPSFLKIGLDSSHINTINTYLADTGINYQF